MRDSYRRRRRLPLLLIIASALVGPSCEKAAPEDRMNMACVTRLQLPFYPPIAQSARISTSLTAAVSLANGGSVQSIAFENISGPRPDQDERIFRPALEQAVRASQFAPSCAGKTVRVTFAFQLGRDPSKAVWFEYPNRFEIGAETPVINTGVQ